MKTQALFPVFALCAFLLFSCGTPSPFPLSFPNSKAADDRIVGNWKMVEDTNTNNFYEITKADVNYGLDFQYHVRFFNRGGTNPTYEANIFFSEMGGFWDERGIRFINVPYWENIEESTNGRKQKNRGYFFVRILESNADFSKLTTATVNDPKLPGFTAADQLQHYIYDNISNPKLYSDTVHFYKTGLTTAQLRKPR